MPCSQAEDLAGEVARLRPVERYGTALDLAVAEGLSIRDANCRLWGESGSEFLRWRADMRDRLGAAFCTFWWDRDAGLGPASPLRELPLGQAEFLPSAAHRFGQLEAQSGLLVRLRCVVSSLLHAEVRA